MKRGHTGLSSRRTGDIRKDLTQGQLAGIGLVAISYNEVEVLIDAMLGLFLFLRPITWEAVTSRIHGMEGKIEIVKIAMRDLGASDEVQQMLSDTLGNAGFTLHKRYRDAIIHSRVLDAPAEIALTPGKRGKKEEILLTEAALAGVFERLANVRLELIEAMNIGTRLAINRRLKEAFPRPSSEYAGGLVDTLMKSLALPKPNIEQEIRDALSRYRSHLRHRQSLPPLPEFPEEPPPPQSLEDYGSNQPPPEPPLE
jgi:hypothetical protein